MKKELIIAILFTVIGLVFIFNNKNIARGAAKFYQKLYTEQNLGIMFRALGIVLIIGALLLIVFK